jgi:hypothetical protein
VLESMAGAEACGAITKSSVAEEPAARAILLAAGVTLSVFKVAASYTADIKSSRVEISDLVQASGHVPNVSKSAARRGAKSEHRGFSWWSKTLVEHERGPVASDQEEDNLFWERITVKFI